MLFGGEGVDGGVDFVDSSAGGGQDCGVGKWLAELLGGVVSLGAAAGRLVEQVGMAQVQRGQPATFGSSGPGQAGRAA